MTPKILSTILISIFVLGAITFVITGHSFSTPPLSIAPISSSSTLPTKSPTSIPQPVTASPTPAPHIISITQSDDTQTIHSNVGDQFVFNLGDYNWTIALGTQDAIRQVGATYVAVKPGTVHVTATGAPRCTANQACPMFRILFTVTLIVDPVPVSAPVSNNKIGTIKGMVTLSPTCPTEQMPPNPQCAAKPYQTTIQVSYSSGSTIIETMQSQSDGSFVLTLPFGSYTIQAVGGNPYPRCSSENVSLQIAAPVPVTISCDTGIR